MKNGTVIRFPIAARLGDKPHGNRTMLQPERVQCACHSPMAKRVGVVRQWLRKIRGGVQ